MLPLYDVARQTLFVVPPLICPLQFLVNAPFGRFTPTTNSALLVDGIHAWIAMEIVVLGAFVYALVCTPLASSLADASPLSSAQLFLAGLFLVHYANRAIISPLRTPSRSKSHLIVPLLGVSFNIINGTLMGSYLHSGEAAAFLASAPTRPRFWLGALVWAAGFVGNVLHDEVLLDIRRKVKAKGKAKAKSDDDADAMPKEHYGIPHGYLYTYVSYPNYLCEWVEWSGFALAAAPLPDVTSLEGLVGSIQPPWVFVVSEICVMVGRAYRGHRWYLDRFPDYPRDRRVVVPLLF